MSKSTVTARSAARTRLSSSSRTTTALTTLRWLQYVLTLLFDGCSAVLHVLTRVFAQAPCACLYTCISTCLCIYACTHVFPHAYAYMPVHMYFHISIHMSYTYLYTSVPAHAYKCLYTFYLRPKTEVNGRSKMRIFEKIDETMQNRVLCGRGFPAMCGMLILDTVALMDFCSARLHYIA